MKELCKKVFDKVIRKASKLSDEERTYCIVLAIACVIAFPFGCALRIYHNAHREEKPIVININEIQSSTEVSSEEEEATTEYHKKYHTYDIDYNGNHIIKVDGKTQDSYVQIRYD